MEEGLARFAKANDWSHIAPDALAQVATHLEKGAPLEALLDIPEVASLPNQTVVAAVRAVSAYNHWQAACKETDLGEASAAGCRTPGDLAVVSALLAMGAPRSAETASAGSTMVGIVLKEALLIGRGDSEAALAQSGRWPAADVPPARWLAWRRMERAGDMTITLKLPEEAAQALLHAGQSTGLPEAALKEATRTGLWRTLDGTAQRRAEDEACAAYVGLLSAAPLDLSPLGAIYIGSQRGPLGAVVVDQNGSLLEAQSFPSNHDMARVLEWATATGATGWVVPTSAADARRLARVRMALPGTLQQVKPAGIGLALECLEEEATLFGRPREILKAVVLARRALKPHVEWSRLDPLELGLAEYQNDLDLQSLSAALEAVRALAPRGQLTATRARVERRLNPMLRNLSDLRPGMEIDVQITNLTSFGAFATFGLDVEGLIHISELADSRVNSPSEVVRIGQQLRARVIQVESDRRRVSLTLRSGPTRPRQAQGAKADALAKLNDLFKPSKT